MPYVQEGMTVYTEDELGLGGLFGDILGKAGGWLKEGAKSELLGGGRAPAAPAYVPPPPPSPMAKALPYILIGGAGLVIFLIVRSKKKAS